MPYRKRTRVMKRKPRYAKRFKKAFPRGIAGNGSSYRIIVQGTYDIANSTASAIDIPVSIFVNSVGNLWNPSSAFQACTNLSSAWVGIRTRFDRFRVNALRVKFMPAYEPTGASTNTLYMLNDYDDYSLMNTTAKALSAGAKVFSRIPGASKTVPTKVFRNPDRRYLNTSAIDNNAQNPSSTYASTLTLPQDYFRSIKVLATQVPANLTVGQLICEWDVTLKGINNNV